MPKKLLSEQLRTRTETIEYRLIKQKLMQAAQNKRKSYLVMCLQPKTIMQLQNEGIVVEQITEFGNKKFRLSWGLMTEQKISKKIRWNVDFNERHISVPQAELSEAENDSFVNELRLLGFHIQSAIA